MTALSNVERKICFADTRCDVWCVWLRVCVCVCVWVFEHGVTGQWAQVIQKYYGILLTGIILIRASYEKKHCCIKVSWLFIFKLYFNHNLSSFAIFFSDWWVFSYASSCKQEASRCCFDMTRRFFFVEYFGKKEKTRTSQTRRVSKCAFKVGNLTHEKSICLNGKKLQARKWSVALLLLKKKSLKK